MSACEREKTTLRIEMNLTKKNQPHSHEFEFKQQESIIKDLLD